MARPSNTQERRKQIASALARVMAREGYDGASIALVAREAGLAPGLVHYHFERKQDILLDLLEGLVTEHAARVLARVEDAGEDPGARLDAFIDAHLATGRGADPAALACWVAITAEALRQPAVAARFEAGVQVLLDTLEQLVAACARARGLRAFDARAAAVGIFAAIQGYYVMAAVARPLVPRGTAAAATRRMAEGLLERGKSPRKRRSS